MQNKLNYLERSLSGEWSFFIGRFQPPHSSHIELIKTELDRGRNVCVGLRAADFTKSNPYSWEQRIEMFSKEFKKEIQEGKVFVVILPNIVDVCHGRKVGWNVKEIKLSPKAEAVSATEIRHGNKN